MDTYIYISTHIHTDTINTQHSSIRIILQLDGYLMYLKLIPCKDTELYLILTVVECSIFRDTSLFNQFPINEHFGCFQSFATINHGATFSLYIPYSAYV